MSNQLQQFSFFFKKKTNRDLGYTQVVLKIKPEEKTNNTGCLGWISSLEEFAEAEIVDKMHA